MIANGEDPGPAEYAVQLPDGPQRHVEIAARPLEFDGRELLLTAEGAIGKGATFWFTLAPDGTDA